MLFGLKKFISFWLMPLPFCLTLLVAGLWLGRSPRRARLGRLLIATGTVLLLLLGNKLVSAWLVEPLEAVYPPIPELRAGEIPVDLAACRYVAVLGGGNGETPGLSATNELSTSSLARIVEGTRLLRALPAAELIVSGPPGEGRPSHAAVVAQAAVDLGLDRRRIHLIETAHDTEDESLAVKAIVGDAPVALVTTAAHLRRAAALFRAAGVRLVPCPTDYTAHPGPDFRWDDLLWDTESLGRSTWAVRERVGYLWVWLRGKG